MTSSISTPKALAGIKVIDFSVGIAGPIAAMHLADYGADVVKIELPGGDSDRSRPGFAMWNRNKRSLVIDPDSQGELDSLAELVSAADIVVSNQHGPFEALMQEARESNPTLIHVLVSAYLFDERWTNDVESAGLVWALSGMCFRQSSFEGGPIDSATPYVLYLQGAWAAAGAVVALIEREGSGLGQNVAAGGLHAAMVAYAYIIDPSVPEPVANYGPGGLNPLYTRYECSDGRWILLAALTSKFQIAALDVLGLTEILADKRIEGDHEAMRLPENRAWIRETISKRFHTQTSEEWLAVLSQADIPVGPLLSRDEWMDSPLLDPIHARVEVDDPQRGRVEMPTSPMNFSVTPARTYRPAPRLGEYAEGIESWTRAFSRDKCVPSNDPPLKGLKVLDLGTVLAGPFTGTLLADMGADVIKVESTQGDDFRLRGMPYIRGQRCLAIDLKTEEGLKAFQTLVQTADVIVDNYRAGVLKRLHIDYEQLRKVNPQIIALSITGYGEGNEYSLQPAFDPLLQARSGMMAAQGGDSEPVMSTVGINDVVTSSLSTLAVALAVFHRLRSGSGQRIWLTLAGTSTYAQCEELIRMAGRTVPRVGGRDYRGPDALDRFYETKDGWIRIFADGNGEALLIDAGIISPSDIESESDLADTLIAKFEMLTRDEALETLRGTGVAAVPARHYPELLSDPEYVRLSVFDSMQTADGRTIFVPGRYIRFSRTQRTGPLFPPGVGEHSFEVLTEAGFSEGDIEQLLSSGVVRQGEPMSYRTFAAYYR